MAKLGPTVSKQRAGRILRAVGGWIMLLGMAPFFVLRGTRGATQADWFVTLVVGLLVVLVLVGATLWTVGYARTMRAPKPK